MPTTAVLETINREQLATATDRLLLRGRLQQRSGARSFSPRARGSWTAIPGPAPFVRGSQPCIAPAEGSQPCINLADGSQPYIAPLANGSQPGVTPALRSVHPAPPARRPQPLATYRPAQPTACTPAQPACTPAQPTACTPEQPTMVMRRRGAVHTQMLAVTLGIPLVGLAIGLAALL